MPTISPRRLVAVAQLTGDMADLNSSEDAAAASDGMPTWRDNVDKTLAKLAEQQESNSNT